MFRWGAIPLCLFAVFFAYYACLSEYLPIRAGPDENAHYHAAKFIHDNGRLAIHPQDSDDLYYTVYGTNRTYRPPLYYLTAAAIANFWDTSKAQGRFAIRKASAFFAAGAVAITFLVVSFYTGLVSLGLLSAFLLALMPQFTFMASYANSDIAAMLGGSLVIGAMLLLFRHGMRFWLAVLLGVSIGLSFLTKPTAWVMFPVIFMFSILLFYEGLGKTLRSALLVSVTFLLSIGGWLAFNIIHHGWENFLNIPMQRELAVQYERFSPTSIGGFRARGVELSQLWFNYQGFMWETFRSAVGKLDWLKLQLGNPQYGLYLMILICAVLAYPLRIIFCSVSSLKKSFNRGNSPSSTRHLLFETMLVSVVILQLWIYVWHNHTQDIQVQGRYLMPVIMAVVLMFSVFVYLLLCLIKNWFGIRVFKVSSIAISVLGLVTVLAVHAHAFKYYVVPFYDGSQYYVDVGQSRTIAPLVKSIEDVRDVEIEETQDGGLRMLSTGLDPRVTFAQSILGGWSGPQLMRIKLSSPNDSRFSVYWDHGKGIVERNSSHGHYRRGGSTHYLPLNTDKPKLLRFDPRVGEGETVIWDMALAPLEWRTAPYHDVGVQGFIRSLDFHDNSVVRLGDWQLDDKSLLLESNAKTGRLDIYPAALQLSDKLMMQVTLDAQSSGELMLKWDDGVNSADDTTLTRPYKKGRQYIYFYLHGRFIEKLQLFGSPQEGDVIIKRISFAPVDVKRVQTKGEFVGWAG